MDKQFEAMASMFDALDRAMARPTDDMMGMPPLADDAPALRFYDCGEPESEDTGFNSFMDCELEPDLCDDDWLELESDDDFEGVIDA